ncbi:unnamed protein product, partial [Mesorhabditis spiculigera]
MRSTVLFLSTLLCFANALNIILYSQVVGPSHLDFANSLVESLTRRGHNVDMIVGRMNTNAKAYGTSSARRQITVGFEENSPWVASTHLTDPFVDKRPGFLEPRLMDLFEDVTIEMCDLFLSDVRLSEMLRDDKYDLALMSAYDYCPLAMFHHNGIKNVASYSPTPLFPLQSYAIGLPSLPSYVTDILQSVSTSLNLNFVERTENVLFALKYELIEHQRFIRRTDAVVRKHYGSSFPSTADLAKDMAVTFVNSNELLEQGRPISHKVKYIGGINRREPQKLDPEMEALLGKAGTGNVIFSFGTQILTTRIPREIKIGLVRAFAEFPEYNFIWKFDGSADEMEWLFRNVTNVFPVKWLPQNDMLDHPRTVAFISHMGLNSYLEASYAGVPTISIPIFADQIWNSMNAESRGISVLIRKSEVTEKRMVRALQKVLGNHGMTKKCHTLAKMLKSKPQEPEELFVQWVEYAATFQGLSDYINLPSSRMSGIVHSNLDFIACLSISCLIFVTVIPYLLYRILGPALASFTPRIVKVKKQ